MSTITMQRVGQQMGDVTVEGLTYTRYVRQPDGTYVVVFEDQVTGEEWEPEPSVRLTKDQVLSLVNEQRLADAEVEAPVIFNVKVRA